MKQLTIGKQPIIPPHEFLSFSLPNQQQMLPLYTYYTILYSSLITQKYHLKFYFITQNYSVIITISILFIFFNTLFYYFYMDIAHIHANLQNQVVKSLLLTCQNKLLFQIQNLTFQNTLPLTQITHNFSRLVQNQLVQKIIEEKIRNQLLTNALLLQNSIDESQLQISQQLILGTRYRIGQNTTIQVKQNNQKMYFQHNQIESEQQLLKINGEKQVKIASYSQKEGTVSKKIMKMKNETKNIPKNFGKAIITFIQKNQRIVKRVLLQYPDIEFNKFMVQTIDRRKGLNSIADLRKLWLQEFNEYASAVRALSLIFLKKYSLAYIFNSRISNFEGHIKYRYRLMEGLLKPEQFTCIKNS